MDKEKMTKDFENIMKEINPNITFVDVTYYICPNAKECEYQWGASVIGHCKPHPKSKECSKKHYKGFKDCPKCVVYKENNNG